MNCEIGADNVINRTRGETFAMLPHAPTRQAIIGAGGLIAYTRKRLISRSVNQPVLSQ